MNRGAVVGRLGVTVFTRGGGWQLEVTLASSAMMAELGGKGRAGE